MFRNKSWAINPQTHQIIIHSKQPDFDGTHAVSKSPFARALSDEEGEEIDSQFTPHPVTPEDLLDYQW